MNPTANRFVIHKAEAEKKTINQTTVEEYFTTQAPQLGLAVAEIDGFYPAADKWARNKSVEEMYFVVSGKGKVTLEGKGTFEIGTNDGVWMPKGVKYRVEGHKLRIVIPTGPTWTKEQHEWLD